jgi:hypothetical protein
MREFRDYLESSKFNVTLITKVTYRTLTSSSPQARVNEQIVLGFNLSGTPLLPLPFLQVSARTVEKFFTE